ncbi:hypothetical protein BH24ACT18_BH24ACT18_02050 [soil metagenome]|nr:hypothetical protein [Rubrobacter sp.]MDQ3315906.1 hypothetical protein [Actinomycetota bacterium]MDQ3360387.1 hypothetical protein [Actinomycetota bacterium]
MRFSLTSEAGLNDGLAFPFTYAAIATRVALRVRRSSKVKERRSGDGKLRKHHRLLAVRRSRPRRVTPEEIRKRVIRQDAGRRAPDHR